MRGSVCPPPIPRHLKSTSPHAAPCSPRPALGRDISPAIVSIGDRKPLLDQLAPEIEAHDLANRHDPAIAIYVLGGANNGFAECHTVQRPRRCGSTPPRFTRRRLACLPTFGRINSMQPDPLAVQLYRVTVDHRGPAREGFRRALPCGQKRGHNNQPPKQCPFP